MPWYLLSIGTDKMESIEIKDRAIIGREQFEVVIYYDSTDFHRTGIYDMTVSRAHAELLVEDNILRLRDLGSKNGTFVDGCALKNWRPGKKMNSYVNLRKGNVLQCGIMTRFKIEQERNKLTLRIGESIILPRDLVSDLMKKGMPGSLKGEAYVIGVGKEGTVLKSPKLQIEIVAKELNVLTLGLWDIKGLLLEGRIMEACNQLKVFVENWQNEIKDLNPTIYKNLLSQIYVAIRQQGIITSDIKNDIISNLDILIGAVKKKVELL